MIGTPRQVELAEQIKSKVEAEFDRVSKAIQTAASNQAEKSKIDTNTVIAILEEKRIEVMAREEASYFIRDWRELTDQVRKMIAQDARYQAMKANRTADAK